MARYRVVKRLYWPEPDPRDVGRPPLFWEHEPRDVTYEPGEEVEIQDCEIPSIAHRLEAVGGEGRAVLERVRADNNRPVRRTFIGNAIVDDERNVDRDEEGRWVLYDAPKGARELTEWVDRTLDEISSVRRVMRMLQRGDEPSDKELAAALEVPNPPREVIDYTVRRLRGDLRKVGPQEGSTSLATPGAGRRRLLPPRTSTAAGWRRPGSWRHAHHCLPNGCRQTRNRVPKGSASSARCREARGTLGLGLNGGSKRWCPSPRAGHLRTQARNGVSPLPLVQ